MFLCTAVKCLMNYYLGDDFKEEHLRMVQQVKLDDYNVKMMIAWYFATALAKQYETTIPFLAERRLEKWTHNKAIQKAVESSRISDERKDELRSLRWR